MSFSSNFFSNQTNEKAKNEDSVGGNISPKIDGSNQNNNEISSSRVSNLLVIGAYNSHKNAKNWDINEIKKCDIKDSNNRKINLVDTTDIQKEQICEKFRYSIWGCGAAYAKDDKNHNNPIRHLIFGTKEELISSAGYKEKFTYFYKIGMIKNAIDKGNKRILGKVNSMEPEEYLKQFPEKEVTLGGKINDISNKTMVMFVGPSSFDLFTYLEFTNSIFEGFPLRVLGIFQIKDY